MTPEEFEERMIETMEKVANPHTKIQLGIALMATTLEELGYGAGISVLFDETDLTPDIHVK